MRRNRFLHTSAIQARPGVIRGRATSGTARDVAFLFTGQGAQFFGMGRGLYESQQVFRRRLTIARRSSIRS